MSETLLDRVMPRFDFRSAHELTVAARRERVARALESIRLDRDSSLAVRTLFRLRGLGAPSGTIRDAFAAEGFTVLAETPGREIVLGIAGRFWAPNERASLIRVPDAERFRRFEEPGTAKATMTIRLEPVSATETRLMTETRIACSDWTAFLCFAIYWAIIKPFSGFIRRDLLRAIARRALADESHADGHVPAANTRDRSPSANSAARPGRDAAVDGDDGARDIGAGA